MPNGSPPPYPASAAAGPCTRTRQERVGGLDRQPQLTAAGGELAAVSHQMTAIIQFLARRGFRMVPAAIRLGLELDDDVAFAIAVDCRELTE